MKIVGTKEAISYIKDNSTVGISGSGGWGGPDELLEGLRDYYNEHKHPFNLTITSGVTPGDGTEDNVGMNNLIADGLVGKVIAAHFGMGKLFGKQIALNKFAAYAIPLGVYGHLLRAIASSKPGIITPIGLHTFADPRIEGCKINEKAKEEIVKVINVDDKEYLFYKSFPIDCCLIKATYADKDGNISFIKEPVIGEQVELASAAHNSKGIVIVQVEKIVDRIPPKEVLIHSFMVDYVVIASKKNCIQGYGSKEYRPELTGEKEIELDKINPIPLTHRKICGRRAALELKPNMLINLGVGMPDTVASVANEEGISDKFDLSVEMGPIGGVPVGGVGFGASVNPKAIYKTTDTFDFYDGGGLDMAVLGLAEVDEKGNVNVSKFGPRVTGPGGFVNITQSTKKVIFIGTLTARNLKTDISNQELHILNEGEEIKFKKEIEQITFSSKYARENEQEVLYITERCVFKLNNGLLELTEIAPGIDIEKDILPNMEFKPVISNDLKIMDLRIFKDEKMGIGSNFE